MNKSITEMSPIKLHRRSQSRSNPGLMADSKIPLPGPGYYDIATSVVSKQQKFPAYTMAAKAKQTCLLDGNDPTRPGPGYYKTISMSKDGRYAYAKFANSRCPKFGERTDKVMNHKLCKYIKL